MTNTILRSGIVIAAMVGCMQVGFGQQKFMVGAKGGIDVPNLTAKGDANNPVSQGWSSRLGPYFGLVAIYEVKESFSIQAELNYSSQGGKKNGKQAIPISDFTDNPPPGSPPYVYADFNTEAKFNYLELPILAKWSWHLGGSARFFADAGPYFAYLLAAKNVTKGTTNFYMDEAETMPYLSQPINVDATEDIKSSIKKFNVGIQAGVGISAAAPGGLIMLTIGGNYGFIPVQTDKNNGQNDIGAVTVALGYLFRL